MALMRYDPFRELDRLADQALASPRMIRTMPMEALRRGDQFLVALDLPGVKQDDVDVTVERNVVQVSARRQPLRQEGDEVITDERPQGEFRRHLFLGDNLDANKLNAQMDHGVLTLTIPVSEASKPRKIQVGAAGGGRQSIAPESTTRQPVGA